MAKVGRKAKFTEQDYIEAVKKRRSLNDKDVANELGLNLTSIYRFRLNNPKVFEDAEKALSEIQTIRYDGDNNSIKVFNLNPSIKEWVDMQIGRKVSNKVIRDRVSALYNVCTHLGVNPDKLTVDACSKLVLEMRKKYENGEEQPKGLAYHNIRKPIRIWFMLAKGISGELLTNKGIDASRSKGTGSMATERIPRDVRHRLNGEYGDNLKIAVMKYCNNETERIDNIIEEMHGVSFFMYYTATRIKATSKIMLNDPKSKYGKNMWEIHVTDKGKRGGIEWKKLLYGHGLEKMRDYIEKRFGTPKDIQDITLPTLDKLMFPWINVNYRTECKIMKYALEISGLKTTIQNHIYRHTFAQDGLDATDGNYDLIADLGGWTDTGTLKLSYGKRGQKSKERGLQKMLGYKVEDVTYELRW